MPASSAFVLLCAEEDDLALVQWVHAARVRGLAPEIVTGIEHDDAPLQDALEDASCGLFVLLRSENLGAERMRQIKLAFGRMRRPHQRLFALRIDLRAAAAIDRIAAELDTTVRPRSEISMVIAVDDLFEPGAPAAPIHVPTVEDALRRADRAAQREVTAQFEVGEQTIPMMAAPSVVTIVAQPPARRSRAAAWVLGLGLATSGVAIAIATLGPEHARTAAPKQSPRYDAVTAPASAEGIEIREAAVGVAPQDEPAVVIRVASDAAAEVAPPVEVQSREPSRSRASRRPAVRPSLPTVDAPTPAVAIEPATPPGDAPPLDPAPLEPAPLEAEPPTTTVETPPPAPPHHDDPMPPA